MSASAIRPVPMAAERAVQFRAWIVGSPKEPHARHEARPVPVSDDCETEQQVADSIASDLVKDRQIMVLRTDAAERPERRNLVSLFSVKRKAVGWEYPSPTARRQRAVYRCYGNLETQFCVHDGFRPVRPWRVEDGNPAGHDLTLVIAQ